MKFQIHRKADAREMSLRIGTMYQIASKVCMASETYSDLSLYGKHNRVITVVMFTHVIMSTHFS